MRFGVGHWKSLESIREILRKFDRETDTKHRNIEFRAKIFNLTNTPPLGNPNVVPGSAGFVSITSAGNPRVIQFGVKLNF